MSNVNANINISINSQQALGQLRALQNQISTFNQSVIAGNVAASQAQRDMTRNLTAQINATKGFTTSIANVESSVSRLGRAIDKNKLSLHEYFRYGVASSGVMGKSMKEHAAIMELAGERVKRLQTQYIALEQAHNGYTRSLAVRPTNLFNADSAIAIQRQQIFNKLLGDGSTALVNWGKNTQWAGRQLMVGFTVPLTIFGGVAGKIFMDLEKQVVQFKRVYGDLQTPTSERNAMVEEVKALAKEFTKYGIAVSDTVALAAKAAATGATGEGLIAATTEATRLATLGQIDYQQALDATISLQTALGISSNDLAEATDFLNAVENQTVTSLDDITQAIPLVAPVIKGLGGDVKDLAIFMTAMREGGISANEGANALKSGLASLINPTKAAREQLAKVGIDIDTILSKNKGDLRGLVTEFGSALGTLGKFERQQTLAKMFGKYQFARLGALFSNISKDGSQAARVIDLTAMSAKELGQIAEGELGQLEESVGVKFTAAVEKLKLAIAPIGEAFLKIATPIIDFATKIADAFNNLPDAAKTFITWGTAIGGVLVPTVIMLVGLLGNFAGNMLKIGAAIGRLMGKTSGLSSGLEYLTMEELDAMAASASLEGQTNSLTGALNVQRGAVNRLAASYGSYVAAAGAAAASLPQGFRGPARRMATGGFVAGSGNKDSEPALLMPGEFVVNKKAASKNAALLTAMNSGTLSGYAKGGPAGTQFAHIGERATMGMSDLLQLIMSNPGSLLGYGTGAISTLAGAFGNRVQGNMYPSLGFAASGTVNNLLDKGGLTAGGLLEDWDSRGIERWSESVSRAGLKMEDVAEELEVLDKALRQEIASVDKNTEVRDATIKQMYDRAKTALPENSRLRRGFDPLENIYKEFRGNIPNSLIGKYPEIKDSSGKSRGFKIGNYLFRTKGNRSNFTKGGSGLSKSQLVAAGAQMGNALDSGARSAIGAASPAKDGERLASDYADGMVVGAEKSSGKAKGAGASLKQDMLAGAQSGAQWKPTAGGWLAGGASPYAPKPKPETGGVTGRFTAGTMPASNPSRKDMGFGEEEEKVKKGMRGFGGKLMGGMMAMDGLLFGMSMMENGVGEFAQKIMPAAFAAQGAIAIMSSMSLGMAAVILPLAALAVGLWKINDNMNQVKEKGQDLADAMTVSAEEIRATAEFYGKKTIQDKKFEDERKKRTGVTSASAQKAQAYIATDFGQSILRETENAINMVGQGQAVAGLANKLSRMVMSGAINAKQASAIANSISEAMGSETFDIQVIGRLNELIGPNGQNILSDPMEIAINLVDESQGQVETFASSLQDSIDNVYKQINSKTGEAGSTLTGFQAMGMAMSETAIPGLSWIGERLANTNTDIQQLTVSAEAFGKSIGNIAKSDFQLLEDAIQRNKEFMKNLPKDVGEKRRKQIRQQQIKEEDELRKKIISNQKAAQKTFSDLSKKNETATGAVLDGLSASISETFKDPMLKSMSEAIFGRAGAISKEVQFNVGVNLSTGQLSPFAVQSLLDSFGNDQEAFTTMNVLINTVGVKAASDVLSQISALEDEDLRKELSVIVDNRSAKGVEIITEGLNGINSLPNNIRKGVTAFTTGEKDVTRIGRAMQQFDELPENKKKSRSVKYWHENFNMVKAAAEYFAGLSPSQRKDYLITYTVLFDEQGNLSPAGYAAVAKDLGASGVPSNLTGFVTNDKDASTGYALDMTEASVTKTKTGKTTNTGGQTPSGSDSSSGGDKKDPLATYKEMWKNIQEQLKMYTNLEKVMKKLKGKKKTLEEAMQRGAFGFDNSLVQNMRKAGLSEVFISDLLSKGYKEAKKIFDVLKKRDKLAVANKAFLMGNAGQTVSDNRKAARESDAQIKASQRLVGINEEARKSIAGDPAKAQQFNQLWIDVDNNVHGAKKRLDQFINSEVVAAEKAKLLQGELDPEALLDESISLIDEAFSLLEDQINQTFDKLIEPLEDQISANEDLISIYEKQIDVKQEQIDDQERLNDLDQQAIDGYNREIEMQNRKIETLRREDEIRQRSADALQRELDLMSRSEQEIRDSYQKRIDALDAVAKLNERILQSQQDQLNVAKALSEGDVYAAAQAAAEMQRNSVQYASEQNRAALEQGMENQVAGLRTSGGMTRVQAEAQIQAIQDQSYQTSLQIRDIEDYIYNIKQTKILPLEDAIYARNLAVRDLQNEIYLINENSIEPLEIKNKDLEDQIKSQEKLRDLALEEMVIGEFTKAAWEQRKNELNMATVQAQLNALALGAIEQKYKDIAAAARAAAAEIAKIPGATATSAATGSATNKYRGGMIKKYSAGSVVGAVSGSGGGDTVPAMLTPGEFVIRKSMVDKYGESFLQNVNQGSFSLPKYKGAAPMAEASPKASASVTNHVAPVYNTYSVNVNATTNVTPEDIANTVINRIRSIDNMSVRRVNGY